MSQVQLISANTVKKESLIDSNVDEKTVGTVIRYVQDFYLRPILGDTLYNSLCTEFANANGDFNELSEATQELLKGYIKPYLVNATAAEFLVLNNYKVSHKGVMRLEDNNSTSVTASEVESVKNFLDNYTTSYKSKLVQYLQDNDLIETTDKTDTDITSASIGWFLEK